jgi:enoyl-CoA hydratase
MAHTQSAGDEGAAGEAGTRDEPGAANAPDEVHYERHGSTALITIDRQHRRNAVDGPTADALHRAYERFESEEDARVLVLTGAGELAFCAGADLKAIESFAPRLELEGGPLGFSRLTPTKPTIAAISGYCLAGGLELALWCDLRIADATAIFGVFCRRFGVPLVDLGTVRLPRLIGHSRAMDLILTGRGVGAEEALAMGLVNRVVEPGEALAAAQALAAQLAAFPQTCLRGDRLSALEQWDLSEADATANELRHGLATIASGETEAGARRFAGGEGRHGSVG